MSLILVRYGEIGLKGRNRWRFVRQLRRNMKDALRRGGLQGRVWSEGQRVYAEVEELDPAVEALRNVFGIVSLSPATSVQPEQETIVREAVRQAELAGLNPTLSYHVAARRADKSFPLKSPEINAVAGEAIGLATGGRVDLSRAADVVIGIEVHRDQALLYGRVVQGWGGMPVLTQGRVVVLLSGGIDSPVAAWMMMKRGCAIVPIHFYQSEVEKAKVLELIQVLQRYSAGYEIKPIFLPHDEVMGPLTERLREQRLERWTCILCKRAMLHRAAAIASEMGIQAVVTGDSLGQVASQTLENMAALSAGVDSLVLRPLIGHDKVDTVDLARRVGTFDVSTADAGACLYLPPNVYTQATRDGLQKVVQALEDAGVGTTAGSSPS